MGSRPSAPRIIAREGDLIAERDPRRPSGRLLREGGMEVSYVDLADPSHLEFDYLRWIRLILRAARARRVLHIGGGACALARAMAAEDPGGRQEVCEVDGAVLELARRHFGLRPAPGLRVRQAEGRAHLATRAPGSFDAVVIDAFVGAAVPRALVTSEALADVARVAPLALVNVVDDRAALRVREVAAAAALVYPDVWTLGARAGNTVVTGAAIALDLRRIAAQAAADRSPARLIEPTETRRVLAGAAPLHDESSPTVAPGAHGAHGHLYERL